MVMQSVGLTIAAIAAVSSDAGLSPFDGTWRTDPSTLRASVPPITFELAGDVLTCRSCRPPYAIKADGLVHPVAGHATFDASSVSVTDGRRMTKIDRSKGRVTLRETFTVAPDGKSAELDLVDVGTTGVASRTTRQRVVRAPSEPGARNLISGTWLVVPDKVQRDMASLTLKASGRGLMMTTGDGRSFFVTLDGRPAHVTDQPGIDAVSVRRISDRVLVETDTFQGKMVYAYRMTVSDDGRAMDIRSRNVAQGTETSQVARK